MIKSFCEGFRDGWNVTAKTMATVVLVGLIICVASSGLGFLIAPQIGEDGMTMIWGRPGK